MLADVCPQSIEGKGYLIILFILDSIPMSLQSFYGVYSTLFEKLARQESEAFKERDDDDERAGGPRDCPAFPRCDLIPKV